MGKLAIVHIKKIILRHHDPLEIAVDNGFKISFSFRSADSSNAGVG